MTALDSQQRAYQNVQEKQHYDQHQQHQSWQHQRQTASQPHLGGEHAGTNVANSHRRHRASYSTVKKDKLLRADDMGTSSAPVSLAVDVRAKPANPWRELERQDYVIALAAKGTAGCGACQAKIERGELKLGAFYAHEDKFTLVRWYHQRCVLPPECLKSPMDLCGIEDLRGDDLDEVLKWMGVIDCIKERSWTA